MCLVSIACIFPALYDSCQKIKNRSRKSYGGVSKSCHFICAALYYCKEKLIFHSFKHQKTQKTAILGIKSCVLIYWPKLGQNGPHHHFQRHFYCPYAKNQRGSIFFFFLSFWEHWHLTDVALRLLQIIPVDIHGFQTHNKPRPWVFADLVGKVIHHFVNYWRLKLDKS